MEEKPLVNRVAQSSLVTINLEDYLKGIEVVPFDLKEFLFRELILREKDFRANLKEIDWSEFGNKHMAVFCSNDAIIPHWAYMLVASYAAPHAMSVQQGDPAQIRERLLLERLKDVVGADYQDQRVVIKGCSDEAVPVSAYLAITSALQPYAQSVMYGEPCSTVPIFKRPRKV